MAARWIGCVSLAKLRVIENAFQLPDNSLAGR